MTFYYPGITIKAMSKVKMIDPAAEEVYALATRIIDAVPDETRPGLLINALKHIIAVQTIYYAVNDKAAQDATKLVAEQLIDNVDKMLKAGWKKR